MALLNLTRKEITILERTLATTPDTTKEKAINKLYELSFFNKTPKEMILSFNKVHSAPDKLLIASIIYKHIIDNDIERKSIENENIQCKTNFPEDLLPKWYNPETMEKIEYWSKVNYLDKICSLYNTTQAIKYFINIDDGIVYISENKDNPIQLIGFRTLDYWVKIKE